MKAAIIAVDFTMHSLSFQSGYLGKKSICFFAFVFALVDAIVRRWAFTTV